MSARKKMSAEAAVAASGVESALEMGHSHPTHSVQWRDQLCDCPFWCCSTQSAATPKVFHARWDAYSHPKRFNSAYGGISPADIAYANDCSRTAWFSLVRGGHFFRRTQFSSRAYRTCYLQSKYALKQSTEHKSRVNKTDLIRKDSPRLTQAGPQSCRR